MDRFVVTSLRPNAGKTSIIIGIARALNKKIAYIKPFGERFLYRKKRLWDYDAALITQIFALEENPEDMSIGFHHSKLLYMLDEQSTREKLLELLAHVGTGKEVFFAECGKDITYGAAVHLDALSVAKDLDARLIVIASGDEDTVFDDLIFLKKYVQTQGVAIKGVIINKATHAEDFRNTQLPKIVQTGLPVLGIIPFDPELPAFTVSTLADRLFAKVITGEGNLSRSAGPVFIGGVSVDTALKDPRFMEPGKVVITSGDRSDMIVAALETDTSAVILANHILPSPDLISQATERGIPLLALSADAFEIACQIQGIESLPTKDDSGKLARFEQMVRAHIDLPALFQA